MATLATVETNKSVKEFLESIENESKREDSQVLVKMIQKISGKKPKIWGDNSMVGFGKYKYKRKGGNDEFEWFHVGFATRKTNLTIYLTYDVSAEKELLKKLGKSKCGKGCLYINRLEDVDLKILEKLIEKSKDRTWH
jgi:uncharacterized protein DUF1801